MTLLPLALAIIAACSTSDDSGSASMNLGEPMACDGQQMELDLNEGKGLPIIIYCVGVGCMSLPWYSSDGIITLTCDDPRGGEIYYVRWLR